MKVSPLESPTLSGKVFDIAALTYDRESMTNPMMRWLRARSLSVLNRNFGPGDRVLEIGCGTGDEAIALALRGVQVLATDASAGMVETTNRKARWVGLAPETLSAQVVPAE